MANHVVNIVKFKGAPDRIQELRAFIANAKGGFVAIDFDKIAPMPAELNVEAGLEATVAENEVYGRKHWLDASDSRINQDLLARCRENVKKYGAASWYRWNIENWGTKWNAYSQEEIEPHIIQFETAWSTPVRALESLSEKFPDVEIEVAYADEDIGRNCGRYTIEDGEVTGEWKPRPKSATEFAVKTWGYDLDEWRAQQEEE